jgi:hypothetical protein
MAGRINVSDDDLLWAVRMRVAGHSTEVIAAEIGCSGTYVRAATNRVRNADIKESGDISDEVKGAYW